MRKDVISRMDNLGVLEHFGVRGMKWGKHKPENKVMRKSRIYKPNKPLYQEYVYVAHNLKTYIKTPIRDLTPEQKRIGRDVAINTLLLVGSLSLGQFAKTTPGQAMVAKIISKAI